MVDLPVQVIGDSACELLRLPYWLRHVQKLHKRIKRVLFAQFDIASGVAGRKAVGLS